MKKPKVYHIAGKNYVQGRDVDLSDEEIFDATGRRITEKLLDELLEESFVRGIGRPSLTAPAVHSPEVKARVPKSLKKRLEAEAKRRGKTPSVLIRQALEEFLAKNSQSQK